MHSMTVSDARDVHSYISRPPNFSFRKMSKTSRLIRENIRYSLFKFLNNKESAIMHPILGETILHCGLHRLDLLYSLL